MTYSPLSTASPHQIWSAAMVVSPILRGMLGLTTSSETGTVTLAPHLPADWNTFAIHDLRAGAGTFDVKYDRTADAIELEIKHSGEKDGTVEFQPAISLRAKVISAELNGHGVPFHVAENGVDQHVIVHITAGSGSRKLRIRMRDDFGVSYRSQLPELGSTSVGLRIISESWAASRDRLALTVSGVDGRTYELALRNAAQVSSVDGAELMRERDGSAKLRVVIPDHTEQNVAARSNQDAAGIEPSSAGNDGREADGTSTKAWTRNRSEIVVHFGNRGGAAVSDRRQ